MTHPYDTLQAGLTFIRNQLRQEKRDEDTERVIELMKTIIHGMHMKAHGRENDSDVFVTWEEIRELADIMRDKKEL